MYSTYSFFLLKLCDVNFLQIKNHWATTVTHNSQRQKNTYEIPEDSHIGITSAGMKVGAEVDLSLLSPLPFGSATAALTVGMSAVCLVG